jgi:hypothetical protein
VDLVEQCGQLLNLIDDDPRLRSSCHHCGQLGRVLAQWQVDSGAEKIKDEGVMSELAAYEGSLASASRTKKKYRLFLN